MLTLNVFSRPGKRLVGVKGIVLHWVANPGTSALANRNYFENLKSQFPTNPKARYASAHFIVGLEGEVIQCVSVSEMAYHVGANKYTPEAVAALGAYPNNCTLGIELCHPDASGIFTEATLQSAEELTAALCRQFSLSPKSGIWTHHGITGKICPKWFVETPSDFATFKERVEDIFNSNGGV
jgi:N-acetylmuramoyl-L-alanine amidase